MAEWVSPPGERDTPCPLPYDMFNFAQLELVLGSGGGWEVPNVTAYDSRTDAEDYEFYD